MAEFNAKDLAHRVQGLLQARFRGDITEASRELGVEAEDLRQVVEDETEYPRLDVLSALVRHFGVDACWLDAVGGHGFTAAHHVHGESS